MHKVCILSIHSKVVLCILHHVCIVSILPRTLLVATTTTSRSSMHNVLLTSSSRRTRVQCTRSIHTLCIEYAYYAYYSIISTSVLASMTHKNNIA